MDYEIKSKEDEYVRIYQSLHGGHVDLHSLHGKEEFAENMRACKILADHGFQIEMLPSLHSDAIKLRRKFLPDVFRNKNPDVRINGLLLGDIKTPEKNSLVRQSVISRQIFSAAKQKADIAILNLYEREYTVNDVKKGIVGALQPERNKSILLVWLITKNRGLFTISRQIVFDDSFYEALTHL